MKGGTFSMSFFDKSTGEVIYSGPWDATVDDAIRDATLVKIAENLADETMGRYLAALEKLWYPDVYPEMYYLSSTAGATSTVRYNLQIPGIARLKTALMMDVDGTYPSAVDLFIESIGHLPFTLSGLRSELGPFAFKIFGGSPIQIRNNDAAHDCRVYLEWEMWKGSEE